LPDARVAVPRLAADVAGVAVDALVEADDAHALGVRVPVPHEVVPDLPDLAAELLGALVHAQLHRLEALAHAGADLRDLVQRRRRDLEDLRRHDRVDLDDLQAGPLPRLVEEVLTLLQDVYDARVAVALGAEDHHLAFDDEPQVLVVLPRLELLDLRLRIE